MSLGQEEDRISQEMDLEYQQELRTEESILEALLFSLGRSVGLDEMAVALSENEEAAGKAVERLLHRYEERDGGILIVRVEDRYQMQSNPKMYPGLIRVMKQPKKPVLTDTVLETLAIVAYQQPVTKSEIEHIRGVNSDHAVNRLVEFGLAEEAGRLDAPGRPALFRTTEEFLRRFGLQSVTELPQLSTEVKEELAEQVREEVAESLGLSKEEIEIPKEEGKAGNISEEIEYSGRAELPETGTRAIPEADITETAEEATPMEAPTEEGSNEEANASRPEQ